MRNYKTYKTSSNAINFNMLLKYYKSSDIAIVLSSSTSITQVNKLKILNIEVLHGNNKIKISVHYRCSVISKIEYLEVMKIFINQNLKISSQFIVGDFNFDILDNNNNDLEFLKNFLEAGYLPSFNGVTRPNFLYDKIGSCIDNFFVKLI